MKWDNVCLSHRTWAQFYLFSCFNKEAQNNSGRKKITISFSLMYSQGRQPRAYMEVAQ